MGKRGEVIVGGRGDPLLLETGEHSISPTDVSFPFPLEVTTPAPKTEAPPVHQPSSITSVTQHPRVYRAFSVSATKSPALLPATTASKTSTQQAIRPLEASYSHHTRLHEQR